MICQDSLHPQNKLIFLTYYPKLASGPCSIIYLPLMTAPTYSRFKSVSVTYNSEKQNLCSSFFIWVSTKFPISFLKEAFKSYQKREALNEWPNSWKQLQVLLGDSSLGKLWDVIFWNPLIPTVLQQQKEWFRESKIYFRTDLTSGIQCWHHLDIAPI